MFDASYYSASYFTPSYFSGVRQAGGTRFFSGRLTDRSGNPIQNLTGVTWRFWDDPNGAVTDSGTLSTNALGEFSLQFPASTLPPGGTGALEIDDLAQGHQHRALYELIQVS